MERSNIGIWDIKCQICLGEKSLPHWAEKNIKKVLSVH